MTQMILEKSAQFNSLVFQHRRLFGLTLLMVALVITAIASRDLSMAQVLAAARF